jgi:flagellar motor switch protein FliN
VKDPDQHVDLSNQERPAATLAAAITAGLAAGVESLSPGKSASACERIERAGLSAVLQQLDGNVNALEIRFHRGIEGNVLVLLRKQDFVMLGQAVLGQPATGSDTLSADVMGACLSFFRKTMESAARQFESTTLKAIGCEEPELINPAGNIEGIQPLSPAYQDAMHLSYRLSLRLPAGFPVSLMLQRQLMDSLGRLLSSDTAAGPADEARARKSQPRVKRGPQPEGDRTPHNWNMDLILDVELGVIVSFGETQMQLRDVLKLGVGSVVELDKAVNDPVAIIVNDKPVATGEVVMVDGNYGVKILAVESTVDRIRSLA